jgi:hypothetical protein
MDKKLELFAFFIIFSLSLLQLSNAFIIYLRPPKMIIRVNASDTANGFLVVMNRNNFSMDIGTMVKGNITSLINIKNPSFSLEPNETRNIDFTVQSFTPGVYSGEIWVNYTAGKERPAMAPSEITVIVYRSQNSTQNTDFVSFIILVVIIFVAIFIFLGKKVFKK